MRVVFYCPWRNAEAWLAALRACGPEFAFVPWPELAEPDAIEAAVVWRPPAATLQQLPNLRVICAMGAGVEYLFGPGMTPPPNAPIVRLVDPVMSERMASYVLTTVLYHQRQLGRYREQQRERVWRQMMQPDTADVRIGIMGLGPMGRASASLLHRVGYDVAGWSRRPRSIAGVRCFAGSEFGEFLGRSDFLVCLLPLTPATRGILNRRTFNALPEGAVVINAARGDHLIEADLIAALDAGRLAAAVLDVFSVEPLPADHPLWRHPKVLITPHVASLSNPATGAAQIVATLRAVRAGEQPDHVVDPADYAGPT